MNYPRCDFCGECVDCARMGVPEEYRANLDALVKAVLLEAAADVRELKTPEAPVSALLIEIVAKRLEGRAALVAEATR